MLTDRRRSKSDLTGFLARLIFGLTLASIFVGCSSTRPSAVATGRPFPPTENATPPAPLILAQAKEKLPEKNGHMPKDQPGAEKIKIGLPLAIELWATQNFPIGRSACRGRV